MRILHLQVGLLVCLAAVGRVEAADIAGVVHVKPKLSEADYQKQMKGVKRDDIYKTQGVERVDYKSAAGNVVVYVEEAAGTFSPPEKNPAITQKNASFDPVVLPVLVGTTVDFPNKDVIFHNVFSYSKTKPFDLGLYKSGASKSVTFTKTGEVTVYCSIHRTMKADILVLQNPWFTVTDDKGNFKITGVPAGTYTLRAWHERFPEADVKVEVAEGAGEVHAELTLGVIDLPQVE
ncbi:hypothetical protein HY522_08085 [bacterium]|nr:hypothetical protein [bacterium]